MDFRGKTVLVAGGTRGLGLGLARNGIKKGAKISICGRDEKVLLRAKEQLGASGGEVMGSVCDLANPENVRDWVSESYDRFGSIDVLIYNAGIIQVGPFESMDIVDFQQAIDTHVYGALHAVRAVVPYMKTQGEGRIALIASMGGKRSVPHMLPYDVSKFALVGLGEGLSIELAKDGIFVTTVCPALMRTGSPGNAFFKGDHRQEYAWFSILDSMPGISVSAEYAARKIYAAISAGQSLLIYPFSAKLGATLSSLAPEFYVRFMRQVEKILPRGKSHRTYLGKESHSVFSPSLLTTLNEVAAVENNECYAHPEKAAG